MVIKTESSEYSKVKKYNLLISTDFQISRKTPNPRENNLGVCPYGTQMNMGLIDKKHRT